MRMTTLCYIEKDNNYLMLHRIKKENDENKDKWIGIGGHFEEGESPQDCLLREVKEETNLDLLSYTPRGFITFVSDEWGTEYMHLFTADSFTGKIGECNEGELCWIDKSKVYDLPIWEGDKIFFRLLETSQEYFFLKLEYQGSQLVQAVLNSQPISLI
ncbi:Mutator mutT protein (7,8-dihydro-8-oxoguanine-triphosphatase) [Lachnospiraceae bacterium TWA4]|nr:Mutator mutT protein (7,8-dihydro-8-oxoguanine-triphosphatase) [Lachnospiraceae bacterium TWA4]